MNSSMFITKLLLVSLCLFHYTLEFMRQHAYANEKQQYYYRIVIIYIYIYIYIYIAKMIGGKATVD